MRGTRTLSVATGSVLLALGACSDPEPVPPPPPPAPRVEVAPPKPATPRVEFAGGRYWIDVDRMADKGWTFVTPTQASDPLGGPVLEAEYASPRPTDRAPAIRAVVTRYPHTVELADGRNIVSQQFKHWGKRVPVSDLKELVLAFHQDWTLAGTDILRDWERMPGPAFGMGPAKLWGRAVGSERGSLLRDRRDRHDWLGWVDERASPPATFVAAFVVADHRRERDDSYTETIRDLMLHVSEAVGNASPK